MTRRGAVHATLLLVGAVWLVPTLGLFVTSWRPSADVAASGWWTALPGGTFTAGNYREVLTVRGFEISLLNSVLIALPATLLPIVFAAPAAYALAWHRFRGRRFAFLAVVALLVVPLQLTWVPILKLFNLLGLTGSFVGIWLAHTAFGLPFAIFLLHDFMAELPGAVFESARIDGASELRLFLTIVLPLSTPALASLAIFQFVWVWNDLINALIFLQDRGKYPLTAAIQGLLSSYGSEWHLLAAGSFVSMSVPLLVFVALQRHFIRGLTAGAVKG
ncbi:MAG: carbohydrate ABC transporter permease [Candidatus Lambdaproteobacteria bacterium]|nr:carbohydrate ABC transporter permease [Candidatus Lambdaproteobacteria bacterium]